VLDKRTDVRSFQGQGVGMTPTQGCTLGFEIQPPRGLRSKLRRNPEMKERPHIKAAARDATAVSIGRGGRRFCNFVGRQQLVEGAPVSRMPLCAMRFSIEHMPLAR